MKKNINVNYMNKEPDKELEIETTINCFIVFINYLSKKLQSIRKT